MNQSDIDAFRFKSMCLHGEHLSELLLKSRISNCSKPISPEFRKESYFRKEITLVYPYHIGNWLAWFFFCCMQCQCCPTRYLRLHLFSVENALLYTLKSQKNVWTILSTWMNENLCFNLPVRGQLWRGNWRDNIRGWWKMLHRDLHTASLD